VLHAQSFLPLFSLDRLLNHAVHLVNPRHQGFRVGVGVFLFCLCLHSRHSRLTSSLDSNVSNPSRSHDQTLAQHRITAFVNDGETYVQPNIKTGPNTPSRACPNAGDMVEGPRPAGGPSPRSQTLGPGGAWLLGVGAHLRHGS